MKHEINLYLTPKRTTLLAFERINDQTSSIVPCEIKGAELRFLVVDYTKMALDLKLLDSLADYKWNKNIVSWVPMSNIKGEKEELRKYIIEFRNAALKRDISDIFELLDMPKVLEQIILEYSMMNSSGNSEEVNSWAQLLCGDDSKDFKVSPYFPWARNQTLTQSLVEDEFYRPLKQKHISPISLFLPHLANILSLPTEIIKHISGYIDIGQHTPKRVEVVSAIKSFIESYESFLRKNNGLTSNVDFVHEAYNATSSLLHNPASAFEPMKKNELLPNQFPIKNPLDFLVVLVTQPVFCSNQNAPMTLLELILHNFDLLTIGQIRRIPEFFQQVRALYESSYIIAMNKDALTQNSTPKKIMLPFEQFGPRFPVTELQDEKGELRFTFLLENSLQRNWSLQLLEALRDYSGESKMESILKLESIFDKIRPNLDIAGPYLPNSAVGGRGQNEYRDYDYPVHFPWDINDEKSRLTDLLIEEKIYGSQTRKDLISRILPVVLPLPGVLSNIINDYAQEVQPDQESVIKQIEAFIGGVRSAFATICGYLYEHQLLNFALEALKAIRNNSGFEPFEAKIFQYPPLPVKNAYDFMTMLVTQRASGPAKDPTTFFEIVINFLDRMQPSMVRQVPEFFYGVKALVESAYILSGNVPSHVGFYLPSDMVKSLCIHVDRNLKLGNKLKVKTSEGKLAPLHNRELDLYY